LRGARIPFAGHQVVSGVAAANATLDPLTKQLTRWLYQGSDFIHSETMQPNMVKVQ
jgi:hypothetical protein